MPDVASLLRRHSFWLALIVLVGVALRLWLIALTPLDPRFSNADDGDYFRRALRLAVTGQYLDDSWLIRPPLHVFFFAAWIKLALLIGRPELSVLFIQLAQTGLAALTILLGFAIARRMFASERAGLFFAAFLAVWYSFVEQPGVLFTELIYLFLFSLHVWLLLRFDSSSQWRWLALSGLALGCAALTRSPALYSLAFVALWLLVRDLQRHDDGSLVRRLPPAARRTLPHLALIGACTIVIVGPWTLRNYLEYQRFIPVDTLGQINLWLDLDAVAQRNPNIDTLRGMPQADRAAYALEQARCILAEDPLRPFDGIDLTFRHIWKAQFVEDYYVKQSFFTRPLRESAALGLMGDIIWAVVTLAGVVGLAGTVREGWHHRLFVLAWLGYSLLTVLVFHVEPRYLLPIWMLIGLYGSATLAGLHWPPIAFRASGMRRIVVVQTLVALGFLLLVISYRDYPAFIGSGAAREAGMIAGERAFRAGDYVAAEQFFRSGLAAQPGFVDGQGNLGLALAAQGRRDEAKAVVERHSSRRADLLLAALLRDAGDTGEAARRLTRTEAIAGEDMQRWALEWLRPPATRDLVLGNGLDIGYIAGFSPGETDGQTFFRWLEGNGRIVLPLDARGAGSRLELRLSGGRPGVTPLTVWINGSPAQTLPVEGGVWRVYTLAIPPEQAGVQRLDLRLSAPTFVPALTIPGSEDARTLSLMIGGVRVP